MSFRVPRKEPPNRAPAKRDDPFPKPSNYLLKLPVSGLPRFPNGPLRRDAPVSRVFFYTFPSKSPVNEPPPCSPTGSLWREKLHLQSLWFVPSFLCVRVPNKEPYHEKRGKYLVTVHEAPSGQKAYIQCGAACFPKGMVCDTGTCTPVPCSLQHDTFHLGLGRPEPR